MKPNVSLCTRWAAKDVIKTSGRTKSVQLVSDSRGVYGIRADSDALEPDFWIDDMRELTAIVGVGA